MTAITWIGLIGIVVGFCAIFALKRFADSRVFFLRVAHSHFLSDSCKQHILAYRSMSFSPLLLPLLLYAAREVKKIDRDKMLIEAEMDSKEYKICFDAFLRTLSVNATAYMPLYFIIVVLLAIRFLVRIIRQQTNGLENMMLAINSPQFMSATFAQRKR
ncbi:MAG: hypothetical protein K2N12_08065 [Helicobacter sp.]|nr:hypothetical protein [Helicobacter sp.]